MCWNITETSILCHWGWLAHAPYKHWGWLAHAPNQRNDFTETSLRMARPPYKLWGWLAHLINEMFLYISADAQQMYSYIWFHVSCHSYGMPTACLYIRHSWQHAYTACLRHAYTACSRHAYNMPTTCLRHAYRIGIPMASDWHPYIWHPYGIPIWHPYGIPMASLWHPYDMPFRLEMSISVKKTKFFRSEMSISVGKPKVP